jgi:hypothetical protein
VCGSDNQWRCPPGGRIYETVADPVDDCLPFHSADGPFESLGSTGIPVETGGGGCMWILGDAGVPDGSSLSFPGVIIPGDLPAGACPSGGSFIGGSRPVSVIDPSELGEESLVGLGDAIRYGDESWIYVRHWVFDSAQPFGVRKLGTRLGWLDEEEQRVKFLDGYLWAADADFGDSALLVEGVPYVYGCYGEPHDLGYDCRLARADRASVDQASSYRYYEGTGSWTQDPADAGVVFFAGPHRSSVRFLPALGRYIHVFIEGFGDHIDYRLSDLPEGPWTSPRALAGCRLPPDDPDAFCGYPMLHPEISDPFAPFVVVVTYDIGTLAPDGQERRLADPAAYWPRLVRVSLL